MTQRPYIGATIYTFCNLPQNQLEEQIHISTLLCLSTDFFYNLEEYHLHGIFNDICSVLKCVDGEGSFQSIRWQFTADMSDTNQALTMPRAKSILMIGNLAKKPENLKTVSHHRLMTRLMQSRYGITWCRARGNDNSARRSLQLFSG